jgi:hypothetical protein
VPSENAGPLFFTVSPRRMGGGAATLRIRQPGRRPRHQRQFSALCGASRGALPFALPARADPRVGVLGSARHQIQSGMAAARAAIEMSGSLPLSLIREPGVGPNQANLSSPYFGQHSHANEALFEAAPTPGRRIGMRATLQPSVVSTGEECRQMAAAQRMPKRSKPVESPQDARPGEAET